VLQREDQRAVHGLSRVEVLVALAELAALCEPVETHFRWRPQTSDPADDMVLEAAVNGRAEFLVTHNVRDFVGAAAKATPKNYRCTFEVLGAML
jgi:predicted nucleic acid-binding protein